MGRLQCSTWLAFIILICAIVTAEHLKRSEDNIKPHVWAVGYLVYCAWTKLYNVPTDPTNTIQNVQVIVCHKVFWHLAAFYSR